MKLYSWYYEEKKTWHVTDKPTLDYYRKTTKKKISRVGMKDCKTAREEQEYRQLIHLRNKPKVDENQSREGEEVAIEA